MYPPVSFHFKVTFTDIGDKEVDSRFQSVAGLSTDVETEPYKEGGENRFEHILPVRTKYPNLVLKRGLITDSDLIDWAKDTFRDLIIKPTDIVIDLLNDEHKPLISWNIVHAWPKKWAVSDFNAEQNALAIETFELQYQYFTII